MGRNEIYRLGIPAKNEKWGEWRGWERGISHIDMLYPRVKSLEGMQLAWCPSTAGKTVIADLVILADVADSNAFLQWLPAVKGKFVMISMNQPTGRPDYNCLFCSGWRSGIFFELT